MMMSCWDAEPDNRPSFAALLNKLDDIINDTEASNILIAIIKSIELLNMEKVVVFNR